MSRVKGIVSAGLASASQARDFVRDPVEAEDTSKAVQGRLQRAAAAETSTSATDLLESGLAGAGAGFVFGPVAGLLTLGISNYLQKQQRAGLEAYRNQAAASAEDILASSESALADFENNATTDQERAEAALKRKQFDALKSASYYPDPTVAGNALVQIQALTGTLYTAVDDWQSERLEAERQQYEQDEAEFTRADSIRDDVYKEGATFLVRQDAYERMLAVEDTAAGDQVLLVNAFKMVDPNSAVLPGEAATAANVAGIPDALVTLYNRVQRDGERLTPDQRADLIRQAGIQYQVARADQVDRNTAALERARDFGIRDELLRHIAIPVKSQDDLPFPTGRIYDDTTRRVLAGPIVESSATETPGAGTPDESGFGPRREYVDEDAGSYFTRGLMGVGAETADLFSDILVGVRGGRKFIGEDGNTYAEYPDGRVEPARPDSETMPSFFDAWKANRAARDKAEREAYNARIRRDRRAAGADPETGVYPIRRPTNE